MEADIVQSPSRRTNHILIPCESCNYTEMDKSEYEHAMVFHFKLLEYSRNDTSHSVQKKEKEEQIKK